MRDLALLTGGAGFIGSWTAEALAARGMRVRVLDCLLPQVHGEGCASPRWLPAGAEFVRADVRDAAALDAAMDGVSVVFHFAAETGVGQSMYEPSRHVDVNVVGTARLWEAVARRRGQVRRVVLPSSRAIYGEGRYECAEHGAVAARPRTVEALRRGDWTMRCPRCGAEARAAATDEPFAAETTSVYGLSKRAQEDLCRVLAQATGVSTVALRYFNVYGPRQAPGNPYTGVVTAFATRVLAGAPIDLYEDGLPVRDFVHVRDVVRANLAALDLADGEPFRVFNVGTGAALTIEDLARGVASALGAAPEVRRTKLARAGDVFACWADTAAARTSLGFAAAVGIDEGLRETCAWIRDEAPADASGVAADALRRHGVLLGGDPPPAA